MTDNYLMILAFLSSSSLIGPLLILNQGDSVQSQVEDKFSDDDRTLDETDPSVDKINLKVTPCVENLRTLFNTPKVRWNHLIRSKHPKSPVPKFSAFCIGFHDSFQHFLLKIKNKITV